MEMIEKVLFTWSGGKDSALALYELQSRHDHELVSLLTTLTEEYDRISMHGIRSILLEQQANSLDIPIEKIYISKNSSNEGYEAKMREVLQKHLTAGVSSVVFGDIFLEDVRKYREENLSKIGMKAIFPIWKRDTTELAHRFIDLGFKAVITCVDSNVWLLIEGSNLLPISYLPCPKNHTPMLLMLGINLQRGAVATRKWIRLKATRSKSKSRTRNATAFLF